MKKRICLTLVHFILLVILFTGPARSSNLPVIDGQETVDNGDSVSLRCTYDGNSSATLQWLKLGEALLPDGVDVLMNSSQLSIASVNYKIHAGSYQCVAMLPGGSEVKSALFNLTVQYFEGYLSICEVSVDGSPVNLEGPVYKVSHFCPYNVLACNATISFRCCFASAQPSPAISWNKKGGPNLQSIEEISIDDNKLTITSLFHQKHNGEYQCIASHPLGKKSHTFYLFVPLDPIFINGYNDPEISIPKPVVCAELGGTATLGCEVSGDATEIYWTFENKHTNDTEGVDIQSDKLVIFGVDSSKVGVYKCHVSLKIVDPVSGREVTRVASVQLDINCIQSVTIAPPSTTVGVGKSFEVECGAVVSSDLSKDPVFTWVLPDGSTELGSVLRVDKPGYHHNGTYTCIADNELSESKSATASVFVQGPMSIEVNPKVLVGKLNNTLNVDCSSNISSSFVWKNGTEVLGSGGRVSIQYYNNGQNSMLSIRGLTVSDVSTNYSCEAHNSLYVPVSKGFSVVLSSEIYLLRPLGSPFGNINTSLTIVCPVAGGEGDLTTVWLKNNTPISPSDRDISTGVNSEGLPTMSIRVLSLLHEYDKFSCLTTDSTGREHKLSFSVEVRIPAKFKEDQGLSVTIMAKPGDDVVFDCEVMGKPMPPISWTIIKGGYLDYRNKTFSNGSYMITNVQEEDDGMYICIFYLKESDPKSKLYELRVRQVGETSGTDPSDEKTILSLAQSVFIAIVIASVGGVFLFISLLLCFCLLCRYCCCKNAHQDDSEVPRVALETTSFERKPSLRGSYRFKDNSGILQQNPSDMSSLWTFQRDGNTNSIPMTTASSVAVSPGPPIPSPVPTTPAGPTTSMVTTEDFKLPGGIISFSRQNLKLDNVMGEGEFGPVFKGVARNIIKGEEQSLVAVKVLIPREGEDNLWPSLMEFANQMKLSSPFIASIVGICADSEPFYVIYNYLDRGDLKKFLMNSRPNSTAQPPSLVQSELLQIVTQVANGMAYLYKQQIIHGDLATRNCLVSSNLTVKIADLGIGHDLYPEDYHDNGTQLLPIRWMAPELFHEASEGPSFSLASDVWSFGVFCWEVFAYARQPYDELSDAQVLRLIPEGHILNAPEEGCPPLLFSLMQDCWAASIEQRPLFTSITSAIRSIDVD